MSRSSKRWLFDEFSNEDGYTSDEFDEFSDEEGRFANSNKKSKFSGDLIQMFEEQMSEAISKNDLDQVKFFLEMYAEDLRKLEDESFHVINTALLKPGITHLVIESLFKNGFTVLNHDDYFANSLHIANHRKLSQDIKDLLLQNGATIASLGEGSTYNADMTNSRARLLRENTKQNSAEIAELVSDLSIISHNAEGDIGFQQRNKSTYEVLQKPDLLNYIASYAGAQSFLGDGMDDQKRFNVAFKRFESTLSVIESVLDRPTEAADSTAVAEAVVLSDQHVSTPTR
ncbi:hypothetical protein OAP83_00690 [Rickettsiales bacterium]|nr:hypothetical protein [Rickettsiales bacterium]